MSRKPTSKMSTTQRRLNLLKSTYFIGRRNMTNGLFRLGPQSLTEVSRVTGRPRKGSYFLIREDLRKILRDSPKNEPYISTYLHDRAGTAISRVTLADGLVKIGCKEFRGKAADALKNWALHN